MTATQAILTAAGLIALACLVLAALRSTTMPMKMVILRLSLGIVFLILGVIGSLLPVLQGWIFFLLAFLTLFPRTKASEKILLKAEGKMPRLVAWLRRLGIGSQPVP